MITLTYTVTLTIQKTVIMKPVLLKTVILHVPSSVALEIGNVNAKARDRSLPFSKQETHQEMT